MNTAVVKFQKKLVIKERGTDPLQIKLYETVKPLSNRILGKGNESPDMDTRKGALKDLSERIKHEIEQFQKDYFIIDDSGLNRIDFVDVKSDVKHFNAETGECEFTITFISDWYTIVDSIGDKMFISKSRVKNDGSAEIEDVFLLSLPSDISFAVYKQPAPIS